MVKPAPEPRSGRRHRRHPGAGRRCCTRSRRPRVRPAGGVSRQVRRALRGARGSARRGARRGDRNRLRGELGADRQSVAAPGRAPLRRHGDETVRLGRRERLLLGKLQQALRTGASEIMLEAADLKRLENKSPLPLPDSFAPGHARRVVPRRSSWDGFASFFRAVADRRAPRSWVASVTPIRSLPARVGAYLRQEEAHRPDAIFAEVVHLPEGRVGNVIARPGPARIRDPLSWAIRAPRGQADPALRSARQVVDGRVVCRSRGSAARSSRG